MKKQIAIFGAGISGLAAARDLARKGYDVSIYEGSSRIGGLAKTFQDSDGFTYDNGPRFIFSTLAEKIGIANACEPVRYYEFLQVKGKKYRFPFGFIRNPLYCFSVGSAMITRPFRKKPQNLQEFLTVYYGKKFAGEVLQPLIEKWAGIPANEVSLDFASRLLPTNLSYIFYSLIKKLRGGVTEDYYKKERYIVYPKRSNAAIFEALTKENNFSIHINHPITELVMQNNRVIVAKSGDHEIKADYFISTMPLPELAKLTKSNLMSSWKDFEYRLIRILFIKLDQEHLLDGLWHWFPESKYPFYRISEYKNARNDLAPEGKTLISIEMALHKNNSYVTMSDDQLLKEMVPFLEQLYSFKTEKVIGTYSHVSETAYPILKKQTEDLQRNLTHQTPLINLFIAGRTGMFQYKMTEGSYDSAIDCANLVDSIITQKNITLTTQQQDFSDVYGRPNQIPE